MNYKFYLIATIVIIIAPLVVTIIPKYIFYVNILAILFIVNGYLNFDKYTNLIYNISYVHLENYFLYC